MRGVVIVGAAGLVSGAALGQGPFSQGSVHYSLDFVEYSAATQLPVAIANGVIEPGESAMVRVTMAYDPAHGTPITYPSSILIGSSGSGTIGGFWNGSFNLTGTGGAEGMWLFTGGTGEHRRGCVPPLNNTCHAWHNAAGTIVYNVQPAQFAASVD